MKKKLPLILIFLIIISCTNSNDNNIIDNVKENELPEYTFVDLEIIEYSNEDTLIGSFNLSSDASNYNFTIVSQSLPNAFKIDASTGSLLVNNASYYNYDLYKKITGKIKIELEGEEVIIDINVNILNDIRVYNSGIEILNQQQLDDFGSNKYDEVKGGITIMTDKVNNLDALYTIKKSYSVVILATSVEDLDGLRNLQEINSAPGSTGNTGIQISRNDALTNINALENLTKTYFIEVSNNSSLISLEGINNVKNCQVLMIEGNNKITNLDAFSGYNESIYQIDIRSNDELLNIDGLGNIPAYERYINITSNNKLQSVNLINLITPGSGNLEIGNNLSLEDFCGLTTFFEGNSSFTKYEISQNLYNPTSQDILNGNCKQ